MLLATQPTPSFEPQAPHTLEQAGLSQALVLDLVLRIAFLEGVVSLRDLVGRTKLSISIMHSLLRHMQREQLCEARATTDDDYEFSLSARGRTLALEL